MTPLRIDVPPRHERSVAEPHRGDFSAALKKLDRPNEEGSGPRQVQVPAPPKHRDVPPDEGDKSPEGAHDPGLAATGHAALAGIAPGCIVEAARLFGEHLTAGGLLSWLSLADTGVVDAEPGEAPRTPVANTAPTVADSVGPALLGHGATVPPAVADAMAPVGVAESPRSSRDSGEIDADICRRAAACAGVPDAERWAEKALRLVRSPDGETVLWIRDYRTSRTRLEPAIRALIARAPGLQLHRIMLNGRKIWISGATQGSDDGH